ncbi:virulence factor family protein [Phyllobacterium meliloti]|uniref:virulence factor family protein n=1 Tax=Phyllobacterium meliloti TaxID=555317 RepID=UPI000DD98C0A|nr:AcvB/VirJ family lysyl-phosphatidylglycerol hydrolase [Phyllobacterium sp. T1293]UGX86989.1 virulence factor family protein [Phyllobacterium sp. T1293]
MKFLRRPYLYLVAALVVLSIILAAIAGYLPRFGWGISKNILVTSERLSEVPLLQPSVKPTGIAIQVSQKGGIAADDQALSKLLLDRGFLVLTVNLEKWRAQLNQDTGECTYFVSELEGIAKEAQRMISLNSYMHPVMIGIGEGGVISYASVANAPPATLAGAVALDPSPALATKLPSCEGADFEAVPGQGFSYSYDADLPNPAVIVREKPDPAPSGPATPGFFKAQEKLAATKQERMQIAADAAVEIAKEDASADTLPIVDIPSSNGPAKYLAVFFSGDGGWRDIDKSVGDIIAKEGVHVVGVDALQYFWSVRKPEDIAKDIGRIVKKADPNSKLPVVLLGYSFGANTVPFAWPFLPEHLQKRIAMVGLIGTEETTPFQVSVGAWLGLGGDNEVAPAVAKLPPEKVLCVYGTEEDDTACTDPALSTVQKILLAGDHHYNEKYDALAAKLMEAIASRVQGQAATPAPATAPTTAPAQ